MITSTRQPLRATTVPKGIEFQPAVEFSDGTCETYSPTSCDEARALEIAKSLLFVMQHPRHEPPGRTDREILDQTNELARALLAHLGFTIPPNSPLHLSVHPRAQLAWGMACTAQEILTATDPMNAVAELEGEPPASQVEAHRLVRQLDAYVAGRTASTMCVQDWDAQGLVWTREGTVLTGHPVNTPGLLVATIVADLELETVACHVAGECQTGNNVPWAVAWCTNKWAEVLNNSLVRKRPMFSDLGLGGLKVSESGKVLGPPTVLSPPVIRRVDPGPLGDDVIVATKQATCPPPDE